MTPTEKQMLAQLECKRHLDDEYEGVVEEPMAWMLQAVELLLRHQLELVEKLRNTGILR
jgi:hypothetical protein